MDHRNASTIVSSLADAAFKAALRAAALLLMTAALLGVLAAAATISAALDAVQPHLAEPAQTINADDAWPADVPLLMPGAEPATRM